MRSLRTKITLITLLVIVVVITAISTFSVVFIKQTEHRKSSQILLLLCETGESNLDFYFNSVQKSTEKVATYIQSDLNGLDEEKLSAHINRVKDYFTIMASKTNGVSTFYYRIDPDVSKTVTGFWYWYNETDSDFVPNLVTDITLYDTSGAYDPGMVWFTVPKFEKKAVWCSPYVSENYNKKVFSYNIPIYWRGTFVGVVGIEIDYSIMAEQVDSIRLYDNGYAFVNDAEGNLFYHPRLDVSELTEETMPATPENVLSDTTFIRYTFNGVEREAAWLPLSNGMRLNVTVPVAEMEGDWQTLIINIIVLSAGVLVLATLFIMLYSRQISKPLKQLTEAAEQVDRGNYDYNLTYEADDELGRLTKTFKRLSAHMHDHISNLRKKVFVDALTKVKNKGAFSDYLDNLQTQLDNGELNPRFAVGVFDCDELKQVNDQYGHDKGDIYLKTASHTICTVFRNSPVFRIGGDEFSVILQNEDFENKAELLHQFESAVKRINSSTKNRWEQVQVSIGIVDFNPENDSAIIDVVRRADKVMYENKRLRKKAKKAETSSN